MDVDVDNSAGNKPANRLKRKQLPSNESESGCDDPDYFDAPPVSPAESASSSSSFLSRSQREPKKKQSRLEETFMSQKSYLDGGDKSNNITNGLLFFLAKNNLPFSLVDTEGFRVLMKKAAPLYKPPSRKTTTVLMEEKYDVLSTIVKNELAQVSDLCLTTDIWTDSLNTKSYLGVTAHYLQKDTHKNVVIGVIELEERHTSENIQIWLLQVVEDWRIDKASIVAVVSDSAANIKKAVADAFGAEKQMPCFVHLLNLVPSKMIQRDEVISALCNKVKAIVSYFKKSVVATDQLRAVSTLKLISCIDTRWNSSHDMLVRFSELANKISVILLELVSGPQMLTAAELQVVREFIDLLNPFKEATLLVSGEKYVTASQIIPIVASLKHNLGGYKANTDTGLRLKNLLIAEFSKRFENIEQMSLLAVATILDPRFRKIHFANILHCSNAVSKITKMLNTTSVENSTPETYDEVQIKSAPNSSDFWSFHDSLVNLTKVRKEESHLQNEMPDDFKYYLNQDPIERHRSPVEFWNQYRPSKLYTLARRYLCITASSVSSERLFSLAGLIMTDLRNRLTSQHLQMLIFLNSLPIEDWHI